MSGAIEVELLGSAKTRDYLVYISDLWPDTLLTLGVSA